MPKLKLKSRLRKLRRRLPSLRDTALVGLGALLALVAVRIADGPGIAASIPLTPPKPLAAHAAKVDIAWLPDTVKRWQATMNDMGHKYDIDPNLLAILMTMESGGDPHAKSEAGAVGLLQLMPTTAQDVARKHVRQPRTAFNLEDPVTSIEFGAAYLAYLRSEFGEQNQGPDWNETVELIAAGYNGGPGAAGALYHGEGLHDMQTVAYSRDAYNMWRERHAASSPTYERWMERGGSRLVDKAKSGQ